MLSQKNMFSPKKNMFSIKEKTCFNQQTHFQQPKKPDQLGEKIYKVKKIINWYGFCPFGLVFSSVFPFLPGFSSFFAFPPFSSSWFFKFYSPSMSLIALALLLIFLCPLMDFSRKKICCIMAQIELGCFCCNILTLMFQISIPSLGGAGVNISEWTWATAQYIHSCW